MDDTLARYQRAAPLPSIDPGHSGYFVAPKPALDPALFDPAERFRPEVREAILSRLFTFWRGKYRNPEAWATVWIAGSAISYQWHGDRGGVGDLDVLVGVDIPHFLEEHPDFSGIPEPLIAKRFNSEFQVLQAGTKKWRVPTSPSSHTLGAKAPRAGSAGTAPKGGPSSSAGAAVPVSRSGSGSTTFGTSTESPSLPSSDWYASKVAGVPSAEMSSKDAQGGKPQSLTTTTNGESSGASSAGRATTDLGSSGTASKESNGSSGTSGAGVFELTFYVNPGAADIRDIHPYAAYDLTHDTWTVRPVKLPANWDPHTYYPAEWWTAVNNEITLARSLIERYDQAARGIKGARPNTPAYTSMSARLEAAAMAVKALHDDIHAGRKLAFNPEGEGYFSYYNMRWQAHKRAGTEQAMRAVTDLIRSAGQARNISLYGEKDISTEKAILDASLAPHGLRGMG